MKDSAADALGFNEKTKPLDPLSELFELNLETERFANYDEIRKNNYFTWPLEQPTNIDPSLLLEDDCFTMADT